MYNKQDYLGGLFTLISVLLLINLIALKKSTLNISSTTLVLMLIVLIVLAVLSLLVALDDNHPKRFFYIFWNPIISGILGAYAFYNWIEQGSNIKIYSLFYAGIILYALFVIYWTDKLARKFKSKN